MSSSPSARRPWMILLVLLAVIDVVTVSALLSRNQRLMAISQDIGAFSEQWASRLERLSALRGLAHEVLVDSRGGARDGDSENRRLGQAVAAYVNWAEALRQDLSSLSAAEREMFETELNAVSQTVNTIATHRLAAITLRQEGAPERAAREVIAAQRASAALGDRFASMEAALRAGQSAMLAAQQEAAYSIRRADLAIAAINLLLIVVSLLARSSSLAAREEPTPASVLLDPADRVPSPAPAVPAAPAGQAQPAAVSSVLPDDRNSTDGLDDFPTEFDVQSWRRAG